MQLPAWSRRAVIEDLLDINIFSKMNMLLKERNSKIKEELNEINHSLDLYKTKMDSQSKYIRDLQAINQDMIASKEGSIVEYDEEVNPWDGRDWTLEALEEILDGMVYIAIAILKVKGEKK